MLGGALGVETEILRKPGIVVGVGVVVGVGDTSEEEDFGCWSLLGERIDEGGRMEERWEDGVGEGTDAWEVGWGMPSLSLFVLSMVA